MVSSILEHTTQHGAIEGTPGMVFRKLQIFLVFLSNLYSYYYHSVKMGYGSISVCCAASIEESRAGAYNSVDIGDILETGKRLVS